MSAPRRANRIANEACTFNATGLVASRTRLSQDGRCRFSNYIQLSTVLLGTPLRFLAFTGDFSASLSPTPNTLTCVRGRGLGKFTRLRHAVNAKNVEGARMRRYDCYYSYSHTFRILPSQFGPFLNTTTKNIPTKTAISLR